MRSNLSTGSTESCLCWGCVCVHVRACACVCACDSACMCQSTVQTLLAKSSTSTPGPAHAGQVRRYVSVLIPSIHHQRRQRLVVYYPPCPALAATWKSTDRAVVEGWRSVLEKFDLKHFTFRFVYWRPRPFGNGGVREFIKPSFWWWDTTFTKDSAALCWLRVRSLHGPLCSEGVRGAHS